MPRMTALTKSTLAACFLALLSAQILLAAQPTQVLELWPGTAPGEKEPLGEERDQTKPTDNQVAGRPVIRIGSVTKPTLSFYTSKAASGAGPAVVVCPGGGYHILAMDLEGTEICEWLNSVGVHAVLLKYRVPKRAGLEKHAAALQDAQRAMGLVRLQAAKWGIDPARIGVLGFSAGGHLAAVASNQYSERSYPPVDEADRLSCRPDFTVLIYPAYLTVKDQQDAVAPELPLTTNTPPTFIAMSQDDPVRVETALYYAAGLRRAKVPFELHIYPSGGHGYGLRSSSQLVTTWPQRTADWMRSQGFLKAE
jgi:acetyl esterase/lipase